MKTLTQLMKHSAVRFKTMTEMINEFGTNWMDNIPSLGEDQAMLAMSYYSGKMFYPELVRASAVTIFRYGPTELYVHECMLTTRALPKYDLWGNIIKVGNIVHCEYMPSYAQSYLHVNADLRNEAGTLTKVLKVVKPADYITDDTIFDIKGINTHCVAVELNNPASGGFIDMIQRTYGQYFKDGRVCGFESIYRIALAKDHQKEFYNKIRG